MLFQPSSPIIVRVVEEPEFSELAEVLMGAIGLAGVLALVAVVFGVLLAGVLILYKMFQQRLRPSSGESETQELGLTRPGPG